MKRIRPALLFLLAFSLLHVAPARATKYAGEFLKIPVGARAIGMGGGFSAVADDATAPYWNPAGMVYLPYREVTAQHDWRFGNLLVHDHLAGVMPLGGAPGKKAAIGFTLIRLATDDIPVTPRPGDLRPGEFLDYGQDGQPGTFDYGEGDGRWEVGERLLLPPDRIFMASSSDMAALISYARQHGPHWAYGVNLKFVRQSIPDTIPGEHATSFGAGLDAGLLYMPTDAITLSASCHDLTTTYLAWSNGTHEQIAPTLDTGIGVNFFPAPRHAITFGLDLAWGFERRSLDSQISLGGQTWDIRTGLEYWYANMVALRAGAFGKDLTLGAGVRYKQFGADYAASMTRFFASDNPDFPSDTSFDPSQLISIGWSW
jgi:hypothetical protein